MKKSIIRTMTLTVLIFTSLALSWLILTVNDYPIEEETGQKRTTQSINQESLKVHVLAPAQIVYHGPEGMQMVNTENLADFNADSSAEDEELTDIRLIEEGVTAYQAYELFQSEPTFIHTFDHSIPFSSFTPMVASLDDSVRGQTYDFMIFPVNQPERVLFYNSDNQKLYEGQANGSYIKQLSQQIDSHGVKTHQVNMHFFGNTPIYLPLNTVEIKDQDYLLERLPNNIYVDQLFDDPSEVNVRYLSSSVRYNDLYSELSVNEDYNILKYSRQGIDESHNSIDETFKNSFQLLNQFENWPHGLHYDQMNPSHSTVRFRRYLNGYPVFAQNGEDIAEISVYQDELVYLQLNLTIAQTPIDAQQDEHIRTLDDGQTVAEKLRNTTIDSNQVNSIRAGMKWEYSDESDRVVHFTPQWFVNYNDKWYSLEELIENDN